jgi:hypothetical protein
MRKRKVRPTEQRQGALPRTFSAQRLDLCRVLHLLIRLGVHPHQVPRSWTMLTERLAVGDLGIVGTVLVCALHYLQRDYLCSNPSSLD